MTNEWIQNFTPAEREAVQNLDDVVNTFQWSIYVIAGLLAMFLFVLAANRSRQGDFAGAAMSTIGAIVCALAPLIAKNFLFGGQP